MRRGARRLPILARALLFSAALIDARPLTSQTVADAKGKYTLLRVGDVPLPDTIPDAKGNWIVRDGWLEVYANGSWILKVSITDPRGRSKPRGDLGSVSRAADALTFKSAIYGTHAATLGDATLELSYDIVGDSLPERLVFARPDQKPAAIAKAPAAAQGAASSPVTPTPSSTAGSAPPPATSTAPGDSTAPFELAGAYHDHVSPPGAAMEVAPDGSWKIHWSRASSAPGFGGVYFSGDHGTLARSGNRLVFRSSEYGDFDAIAGGHGTIVLDYYLGAAPVRWRFVKDGVADDPKAAPAPQRETTGTMPNVKWSGISAGAYQACALTIDGAAYCWGLSAAPEGSAGGNVPRPVGGGVTFAALSVGSSVQCDADRPEQSCENNRSYHICALTSAGDGYCWGDDQYGQLGDGSTATTASPVQVAGGHSWIALSAGEATTCGITREHALYCWGRNDAGQLGSGAVDNGPHSAPQLVAGAFRSVSVGSNYVCAVKDDGSASCWGSGSSDRLGTGASLGYGPNPTPLPVESQNQYTSISAGRTHACATTSAGAVECWGDNYYGESGPGDNSHRTRTPTSVGGPALTAIAVGDGFHSCGLTAQGSAYCWGRDGSGRLGLGSPAPEPCGFEGRESCSNSPLPVAGGHTFKSISAGLEFTCALSLEGDAYCWGDNSRGQLGTGDRTPTRAPVRVTTP